jgi:uncharacterized protein
MWSGYRTFVVDRKTRETALVTSLHLVPEDGQTVAPHQPGQHLPIRCSLPGQPQPTTRFYTISDTAKGGSYRLSIKKVASATGTGLFSAWANDVCQEGDCIEAKAPQGDFFLRPADASPVCLIAGGIGVTPLLAMVKSIADVGNRDRDVRLLYAMRSTADHAFRDEFLRLAGVLPRLSYSVFCAKGAGATDADRVRSRRISMEDVLRGGTEGDFFVCGPAPMMEFVTAGLRAAGVAGNRIRTESFGPASEAFQIDTAKQASEDAGPAQVTFRRSGITLPWNPAFQSIWQLADANNIAINSGCLFGDCGTCMTRLLEGDVRYNHPTVAQPDPGTCLVCSCRPAGRVTIDA